MNPLYKKLLLTLVLSVVLNYNYAQDEMKLGDWDYFLTYNVGYDVTQSEDAVYYASDFGVVVFYKEDLSTRFLSKLDVLSDIEPRKIKYNAFNKSLIIGYKNANIDVVTEEGVFNIPDFLNSTAIFGKKNINNIFTRENYAYIASDFGLSVIDLTNYTILYTTFTPSINYEVTIHNDILYAATKKGIFKINANHVNIADFNNWTKLDDDFNFPNNYESKAIGSFDGGLYADMNNQFIKLVDDQPIVLDDNSVNPQSIAYISEETSNLMVGYNTGPLTFGKLKTYKADTVWYENFSNDCRYQPLNAVEDQQGRMWYADRFRDIRQSNQINFGCISHSFNTPFSFKNVKTVFHDDEVWVASGAYRDDGEYNAFKEGVYIYKNGEWSNINSNNPQFGDKWMWDMLDIVFHPETGDAYIASYVGGLIHKSGDVLTVYDKNGSSLSGAVGDDERTRVSGLAFDQDNNLWISNHAAPNPISVLKNDGSWHSISGNIPTGLLSIAIDNNGYKWFVIGQGEGIMVYDEGDNIENVNDDIHRVFLSSNSNLPSSSVNCVTVDKDGAVWVGTSQGVVKFDCGSDVFDTNRCKGSLNIINVNGDNAYLLSTEDVKSIAIDGANRKWFGTTNGVFVQSADGNTQIYNFTKENSPLPHNTVYHIGIHPTDGTVYFSTESGLVTYRADAIDGDEKHTNEIYAYPNPVRPEYDGPIAVKGLAQNSNVKITDITGRLVYEGTSLGSQFIWNGKDYLGQDVSSGVYLVFANSSDSFDAPDSASTKILIVR